MRKGWKKKKIQFLVTKLLNYRCFDNLYRTKSILKGLAWKAYFSLAFYTERLKNKKKTIFCYKKGSKSKTKIILKIFGRWLYKCFGILYRTKSILKGLAPKAYFSLAFYAERLENTKIQFLVTKRGQNQKSRWFLKSLEVTYIEVLALFIALDWFWRI